MTKNELGKLGEDIACNWLLSEGYVVKNRNWRTAHCEVDIIASKNKIVHFFEVKTRTNITFGYPEESINQKKMNCLKKIAVAYLSSNTFFNQVQFNAVAIILDYQSKNLLELKLIEDIYF
ncbi:MAG: YraN family protein [Phycisphaerales bacterium]|nr:YraN family protein [Phycisphaerales bacterium]